MSTKKQAYVSVPVPRGIAGRIVFEQAKLVLPLLSKKERKLADAYLTFFPEGTNPIYRVRTEHMAALEAKVATINRRVVRKGLEHPIVLTRVGTEMVEVTETREDGSTEVIGEYEVTLVTVNAERPKYNGWTFLAIYHSHTASAAV